MKNITIIPDNNEFSSLKPSKNRRLKHVVVDLRCGLAHALLRTGTGRVYSWGNGGNGRLGLGDTIDRLEVSLVSSLNGLGDEIISSVKCGASHSLALSTRGLSNS